MVEATQSLKELMEQLVSDFRARQQVEPLSASNRQDEVAADAWNKAQRALEKTQKLLGKQLGVSTLPSTATYFDKEPADVVTLGKWLKPSLEIPLEKFSLAELYKHRENPIFKGGKLFEHPEVKAAVLEQFTPKISALQEMKIDLLDSTAQLVQKAPAPVQNILNDLSLETASPEALRKKITLLGTVPAANQRAGKTLANQLETLAQLKTNEATLIKEITPFLSAGVSAESYVNTLFVSAENKLHPKPVIKPGAIQAEGTVVAAERGTITDVLPRGEQPLPRGAGTSLENSGAHATENMWAKFRKMHWGKQTAIGAGVAVVAGGVTYWALKEKEKETLPPSQEPQR